MAPRRLPEGLRSTSRRVGVLPTRLILSVSVAAQKMSLWERASPSPVCNGRLGLERWRSTAALQDLAEAGTALILAKRRGVRRCSAAFRVSPYRYELRKTYVISTSAFGVGQVENSNRTPLGLHRIARKMGGGYPVGAVFRAREHIGFTWEGLPKASIVHRILWLEGLEPGFNSGGNVDSFRRYIYIHGFGDETTLGRPKSHGCIHVAARDLIPLYDLLPIGTLVWISET